MSRLLGHDVIILPKREKPQMLEVMAREDVLSELWVSKIATYQALLRFLVKHPKHRPKQRQHITINSEHNAAIAIV